MQAKSFRIGLADCMKKLLAFSVIIALVALSGCTGGPINDTNSTTGTTARYTRISAQDFNAMLEKKDFFLLDVYTSKYGLIAKTDASIPYNELDFNAGRLPQDRNAAIVVYCRFGSMSRIAAQKLVDMGYRNVMELSGGAQAFNLFLKEAEWKSENEGAQRLYEMVAPKSGVTIPAKWNDVLVKAVDFGAIDINKYEEALAKGGMELSGENKKLLTQGSDENITFTRENAWFYLNALWAIGLVNENPVLAQGKISAYGENKKQLASVGGWTLGKRSGDKLFAAKKIIALTPSQQELLEEIVQNVYRPCCNNNTAFPDCNHGMAALALAELLISQGATKGQVYDALLVANSYWFEQTYVNIAAYLEEGGNSWTAANAGELLGSKYSSASGSLSIAKSLKSIPVVSSSAPRCAA